LAMIFLTAVAGAFGDLFYLDNGSVLEGKLRSENEEFYFIELSVGSTRIAKSSILKIAKETIEITPKQKLQNLSEAAQTKDDFIQAAEFGFRNQFDERALVLLKRAWILDSKKDNLLKIRIQRVEDRNSRELLGKASKLFSAEKYRQSSELLFKAFKNYPTSSFTGQIKRLRKKCYKHIWSEEESIHYLEKILKQFEPLKILKSRESTTYRIPLVRPPPRIKGIDEVDFVQFKKDEQKLEPAFSKPVGSFLRLFQMEVYIQKNRYDEFAKSPLHSQKDLDSRRGNKKDFNRARSENNKIFKARKVCRQFNQVLFLSKKRFQNTKQTLEREKKLWEGRGYEKIAGEWLREEDAKRAKGFIFYKEEWLDSHASDFDKRKAKIDEKYKSMMKSEERKPLLEKAQGPEILEATPFVEKPEETEELSLEDEFGRSPQKIIDKVKGAIKEEAQAQVKDKAEKVAEQMEKVAEQVEKAKETVKTVAESFQNTDEGSSEESKGLPIQVIVGIFVGLYLIIVLVRKLR